MGIKRENIALGDIGGKYSAVVRERKTSLFPNQQGYSMKHSFCIFFVCSNCAIEFIRYLEQYILLRMIETEEKAPSFLVKLLKILRSKQYSKIINWDAQMEGIKFLNTSRLEQEILPRYFRHKNLKSFIRQLNMYDFHKVYLDEHKSIFCHDIFDPRNKDSITQIKRKVPQEGDPKSVPLLSHFEQESTKKMNKPQNKENIIKNRKKVIQKQKDIKKDEVFDSRKTSFKLLLRNSFRNFHNPTKNSEKEVNAEQILEEIVGQIAPLKLSEDSIREKIDELRNHSKFRRFLKRGSFLCKIYSKLGMEINRDEDKLSQLSIEDELLYKNNKKEVSLTSLKMFESRPVYLRDTIGMFLN